MENYTLDKVQLSECVIIKSIECEKELADRIINLGLVKNSVVKPLFKSPFRDPTAFLVKNTIVALRNKDCKNIIVSPISDNMEE